MNPLDITSHLRVYRFIDMTKQVRDKLKITQPYALKDFDSRTIAFNATL